MLIPSARRRPARTGVAALGLACSLLAVAGCGEPRAQSAAPAQADGPAAQPVRLRTAKDVPFEHSWDLKLPRPVHMSWVSPNAPELLFVQLEGANEIYAIDAFSGRTRFVTQPLPRPLQLQPTVARVRMPTGKANETVNDDRLYVISDDTLFCFDAIYGEKVWGYDLPFTAASGPVAVGPEGNLRVFVGDYAGKIQVLTWTSAKRGFVYPLWQHRVAGAVTATPVESESLVYVGDQAGTMNCFRLDRELVWSFKAGGTIRGPATPLGRSLFFGSSDHVLHVLDRFSGEARAKLFLNAPVDRAPLTFLSEPGRVYVWTTHTDPRLGGLWAIDVRPDNIDVQFDLDAQNKPRKKEIVRLAQAFFVPGAKQLVSSTPDHLYVTRGDPTLVEAVNRRTGTIDWAWQLNAERKGGEKIVAVTAYHDPTDLDRSIFTIEAADRIVAYRQFGWKPAPGTSAPAAPVAPVAPATPAAPAAAPAE